MPQFQLDTSGSVEKVGDDYAPDDNRSPAPGQVIGWRSWGELDAFTQGYIEALFFTWPEDEGDFIGGITSPAFGDLAPEALASIIADCREFQDGDAFKAFADWRAGCDGDEATDDQAGRDFWFTRCGHGVGFWDRPVTFYGACMDALDKAAQEAGNVDAYLGDDGRVYV